MDAMTSDLETTTDDIFNAIRELWQEAQPGSDADQAQAGGFGQSVASVSDVAIAERTGLDIAAVREYLDHADGVQVVVGRDGEHRSVRGLV